ncbi:uncharacterized protein LOC127797943 [Diospyros lotus]|uniref:uncharacterized protein LOC127797943 n=1 Tax=Diospyros lotus TaxID=55363 RepID=UPI00225BA8EB|nr:uncharacterized protein LOC127797943 [Diospyros lotus]XP_052187127.1 uncharacterized protein LOC127797943 [Diospyros lotus]XP_052187128.1 uncharacterized protein LOC127797943 [Diospyros lotus]XP_052187129.1 uncharacterized protein LOC127797943 [Diospyros lotus]
MAKPKQRQLLAVSINRKNTASISPAEPSPEDDWVIVKKQMVRILIPPLPENNLSTIPNSGPGQLQSGSRTATSPLSQSPTRTCLQMQSVNEGETSMLLAPKIGNPTARRSLRPNAKLARFDNRIAPENYPHQADNFRCHDAVGVRGSSRISKRPISFLDAGLLLSQRMRVINLERKLQRAGGLSSWLSSLGLDHFVAIFEGKSVNKFQLVNLTMKKLKDMGANAVGPRRKLMHAIDCLCQPSCFKVKTVLEACHM